MLEVLHVKEFGIYPVVNAKCWKDYEESGDRIKLVFISGEGTKGLIQLW